MSYNLLEESWIPVLYRDGTVSRAGIKRVLRDAHLIRQFAASNPMDRFALTRFFLALLYWCRGNPPPEREERLDGPFREEWFGKLDENAGLFDLLGDGCRFYQTPKASGDRPVTDLLQEVPAGNNFWHFRHSTDREDGLCPACCALGLLRLPLFCLSGLPKMFSGINGTPPIYAMILRDTLAETLHSNWWQAGDLGEPAWMHPEVAPKQEENTQHLVGMTSLARRVWLDEPGELASCNGCGTNANLVRSCRFSPAPALENKHWRDPHTVYPRGSDKVQKAANLSAPQKFRMDRPWPDLLEALLLSDIARITDETATVWMIGFAYKQMLGVDAWERCVDLPSDMERKSQANLCRKWKSATGRLGGRAAKDAADSTATFLVSATRPEVEMRVSRRDVFHVNSDDTRWEEASFSYAPLMHALAPSLAPGETIDAERRRRAIAAIRPKMPSAPEKTKKPRLGETEQRKAPKEASR